MMACQLEITKIFTPMLTHYLKLAISILFLQLCILINVYLSVCVHWK